MDLLIKPVLIIDMHGCLLEKINGYHSWGPKESRATLRFNTESEAENYIKNSVEESIWKSYPEVVREMAVING